MCPRAPSSSRRLQRRPRTTEARRAHRSSRVSYSLPPTPVRNLVRFPNEDSTTLAKRSQALDSRSEEHTSELQSLAYLVCRLLLEKKKTINSTRHRGRGQSNRE